MITLYQAPVAWGLERAQALSLQRMVEDHLYFAAAWLRWSDQDSWSQLQKVFQPILPPLIGGLILKKIRKKFAEAQWAQGMGRHSRDEIIQFAKEDLTALSTALGDKPFFVGQAATSIDAVMYGFLIQHFWLPWNSPLKEHSLAHCKNLAEFCARMKQACWT